MATPRPPHPVLGKKPALPGAAVSPAAAAARAAAKAADTEELTAGAMMVAAAMAAVKDPSNGDGSMLFEKNLSPAHATERRPPGGEEHPVRVQPEVALPTPCRREKTAASTRSAVSLVPTLSALTPVPAQAGKAPRKAASPPVQAPSPPPQLQPQPSPSQAVQRKGKDTKDFIPVLKFVPLPLAQHVPGPAKPPPGPPRKHQAPPRPAPGRPQALPKKASMIAAAGDNGLGIARTTHGRY